MAMVGHMDTWAWMRSPHTCPPSHDAVAGCSPHTCPPSHEAMTGFSPHACPPSHAMNHHLRPPTPRISSRASSITHHHRPHPLRLSRALISGQWTRMASRTCPCQRKRVGWCVRDEAAARQSTLLFGGADNRCDLPPNALQVEGADIDAIARDNRALKGRLWAVEEVCDCRHP